MGQHPPAGGHRGDGQGPQAADHGGGAQLRHVEWSDSRGTVSLNWGQCTLNAGPDALMLRAEAADEDNLGRLQDLMTVRLESFGRRDGIRVTWQPLATG